MIRGMISFQANCWDKALKVLQGAFTILNSRASIRLE